MEEVQKLSPGKRAGAWFRNYLNIIKNTIANIGRDNVSILTSGMVYSTLVALVPCVTFLSAFMTAFGALQPFTAAIKDWLVDTFGMETGYYIMDLISQFSRNAMSLGVVGLVSFIITGMFLINKIYNVFNAIYRTHPTSSLLKRYISFFITLITFTVLISLAFAFSSSMDAVTNFVAGIQRTYGISVHLKKFGSLFSIFTMLFFALKFIPSVKVRLDSAFSGAVLGTLLLYVATFIFTNIIRSTVKYSVIYGAMASLMFVFLYLYLVWYIVIVVAEMTYIYQFQPDKNTLIGRPTSADLQLSESVDVMFEIATKYLEGKGASSLYEISHKKAIPVARLNFYIHDFEYSNLILSTNPQKSTFVPAKPLDQIMVSDIIESVFGADDGNLENETLGDTVSREFRLRGIETFQRISLLELVQKS